MSKAATLSSEEAQLKVRAGHYLAETQNIFPELANERRRITRRACNSGHLVEQVRHILHAH